MTHDTNIERVRMLLSACATRGVSAKSIGGNDPRAIQMLANRITNDISGRKLLHLLATAPADLAADFFAGLRDDVVCTTAAKGEARGTVRGLVDAGAGVSEAALTTLTTISRAAVDGDINEPESRSIRACIRVMRERCGQVDDEATSHRSKNHRRKATSPGRATAKP